MIVGNPQRFAIELEFIDNPAGLWMNGRACYLIAGERVGDFGLVDSLRDVLFCWERRFKSDWGVCSNQASPFDGNVKFEHDGCRHYLGANAWVSEYFLPCPENKT